MMKNKLVTLPASNIKANNQPRFVSDSHEPPKLFFEPRYMQKSTGTLGISPNVELIAQDDQFIHNYALRILKKAPHEGNVVCTKIHLHIYIPEDVKASICDLSGAEFSFNNEAYILELGAESHIWGASRNGLIYGLTTLEQLIDTVGLAPSKLCDYPESTLRGYRVFTPGYPEMDAFKQVVDMMVYYKYNTIMIEVGGAMEYKSHPEINENWVSFCKHIKQKSGNSLIIQEKTYPWHKNSIHADNGSGGFITQDKMREVIAYCRERGLSVIPEVPSLSHCDYLVMAHPELNERKEDAYPDTYCPSNPESYRILFELIDEVIEVFEPEYINIGHDEVYTLAICPNCKGKEPVDLFVGDITKINNYLKSKGIQTMMWCEKLFNATLEGKPVGGAASLDGYVPALYACADKLPRDITMIYWYWSICDESFDKIVHDNGYRMIVGNFNAVQMLQYRKRFKMGIEGGFASNWGSFLPEYMQRNCQNLALAANAYAFWSSIYDTPQSTLLIARVARELYRRNFAPTKEKKCIRIIHTTDLRIDFTSFYDGVFIEDEKYILGYYVVSYIDGSIARLPVKFGTNISSCDVLPESSDMLYLEVLGGALPHQLDGFTLYETLYENPMPDKTIYGITFESIADKKFELMLHEVAFE